MKYLFIYLLFPLFATAQIDRVEPPFWWQGMKNKKLKVLLYGDDLSKYDVKAQGMNLVSIEEVENKNYLFLNFDLTNQEAGNFKINLIEGKKTKHTFRYEIKSRNRNFDFSSFDSSDVVYLLMPDRFANGNPLNDSHPDLKDKLNRSDKDGRHGGDLEGIIKNLDYIEELGATAIWSTPLCEDNDPSVSYHTYGQSDLYRIDPRYGSNQDYKRLATSLHKRGMKLIMDYVTNHWGTQHWMVKDPPTKDWIHYFKEYTNTNHRKEIHSDPYASIIDKKELLKGWFVPTMADLNQGQPKLLNYLIQNAIWWIEFAGIDGFRVDTFPYNNPKPMIKWLEAIRLEYPKFNIVGEGWMSNTVHLSYWQENSPIAAIQGFNSKLPGVIDFALYNAFTKAFGERDKYWEHGMTRIYKTLQNDFLYPNINNVLIFVENHDTNRINDSYPKFKSYKRIMAALMTLRGIPQIYYGSEIGMTGKKENGDGDIRRDFPGGWISDKKNAFNKKERTPVQKSYFNFTKKLINWRRTKSVIHKGKTLHYVPENDVYVYFRYSEKSCVMVIINNSPEKQNLSLDRFHEGISGRTNGFEIISEKQISLAKNLEVSPETAYIIELH